MYLGNSGRRELLLGRPKNQSPSLAQEDKKVASKTMTLALDSEVCRFVE